MWTMPPHMSPTVPASSSEKRAKSSFELTCVIPRAETIWKRQSGFCSFTVRMKALSQLLR